MEFVKVAEGEQLEVHESTEQTESASNAYRAVGTNTVDAAVAITEHGIFHAGGHRRRDAPRPLRVRGAQPRKRGVAADDVRLRPEPGRLIERRG